MPTTTRTKAPWLVVAALVLALVVGVGIGVAVTDDDGGSTSVAGSQQVAAWRQACQQWADGYGTDRASGPGTGWCHGMTDWMYDQMRDGTMGPMMMWGDPERMRDACRRWADTDASGTSSTDASTWCDAMVTWMTDHIGNWGDWDDDDWDGWMHGPMMGS